MDLEDLKTKQDAINTLKKEEIEDFVLVARCKGGRLRAFYAGSDQKALIDYVYDDVEYNDTFRGQLGSESTNTEMELYD